MVTVVADACSAFVSGAALASAAYLWRPLNRTRDALLMLVLGLANLAVAVFL